VRIEQNVNFMSSGALISAATSVAAEADACYKTVETLSQKRYASL